MLVQLHERARDLRVVLELSALPVLAGAPALALVVLGGLGRLAGPGGAVGVDRDGLDFLEQVIVVVVRLIGLDGR